MKSNTGIKRVYGGSKQKGITLIELAISLAIVGAILFGVFYFVSVTQKKRIVTTEAQYLNMMASDLRTKFTGAASFAGISAANLIKLDIAPAPLITNTTMRSGFSTSITIGSTNVNGAPDDGFEFTYQVPSKSCADFVAATEAAFARVTIAGTVVKEVATGDNQISVAEMAGCNATGTTNANVTLLFAQGR